jgi:hypothetical protein
MTSLKGCVCLGACTRSVDLSPFDPGCITYRGAALPLNGTLTCGASNIGTYSSLRDAYWDYCRAANLTSLSYGSTSLWSAPLTTFMDMFLTMLLSSLAGMAIAYFVVCLLLLYYLRGVWRSGWCLSACDALRYSGLLLLVLGVGAVHVLIPGSLFSALCALMYLSIPYAIERGVGIVLGLTISGVVIYFALNRDSQKRPPMHSVEYAEL